MREERHFQTTTEFDLLASVYAILAALSFPVTVFYPTPTRRLDLQRRMVIDSVWLWCSHQKHCGYGLQGAFKGYFDFAGFSSEFLFSFFLMLSRQDIGRQRHGLLLPIRYRWVLKAQERGFQLATKCCRIIPASLWDLVGWLFAYIASCLFPIFCWLVSRPTHGRLMRKD